uniref:J domain-containing protein n=1 Tax=Triticum urartu TaxID=4572 RepID=A0A8R7Q9R8_TRIUA
MADAAGKAQAAREVCAASAAFSSCPHRRRSPRRAIFVDWYLVLAIGEAASEDAIKRRYRHLALQLHPDKNRHPKAEVAFKLVSEAHACLTDKARRRNFDAERATAFCAACHDRARAATTPCAPTRRRASDRRTPASSEATQALREVQNRLRDECRVIDGCLRANAAGARRRQSFPLFDPSDRQRFPDYPHARPPPSFAECRPFEEEELRAGQHHQSWCTNGSCESPVYQVR